MQAVEAHTEYELERGKPMPSKNHGLVQASLCAHLFRSGGDYSILSELSLELGGRKLTPDLSVYSKLITDWQHDEVRMTEPPLMVVEILSPRQSVDDLVQKADAYFEAGVKSCWIVQPTFESIAVLEPETKPNLYTHGEVVDPATGVTVKIEEIFR